MEPIKKRFLMDRLFRRFRLLRRGGIRLGRALFLLSGSLHLFSRLRFGSELRLFGLLGLFRLGSGFRRLLGLFQPSSRIWLLSIFRPGGRL